MHLLPPPGEGVYWEAHDWRGYGGGLTERDACGEAEGGARALRVPPAVAAEGNAGAAGLDLASGRRRGGSGNLILEQAGALVCTHALGANAAPPGAGRVLAPGVAAAAEITSAAGVERACRRELGGVHAVNALWCTRCAAQNHKGGAQQEEGAQQATHTARQGTFRCARHRHENLLGRGC